MTHGIEQQLASTTAMTRVFCVVWEDESGYTTVKYWNESQTATSLVPWMDSSMQLNIYTIEQHADAFVYHVQGGNIYAAACSDCKVVKVYESMPCMVLSFCMLLLQPHVNSTVYSLCHFKASRHV